MCGYCSRSEATKFLRKHFVKSSTDEKRILSTSEHIRNPNTITIDGEPMDNPTDTFTILLNKPPGYICSTVRDFPQAKLVYDLLPERFTRRHPTLGCVGRLDVDTSGLLFLTQDGKLNDAILSSHVEKTYDCVITPPFVDEKDFQNIKQRFESGEIMLHGEKKTCKPAKIDMLCDSVARVTLREGMYHQVKRMFAACSKRVIALTRVRIGHVSLSQSELGVGDWKAVNNSELEPFRSQHNK
jgi:16S rRNA pseudouridine516 synthase